MREPTEDAIKADFGRYRYMPKPQPRPSDYASIARHCIVLFWLCMGCLVALTAGWLLGWVK